MLAAYSQPFLDGALTGLAARQFRLFVHDRRPGHYKREELLGLKLKCTFPMVFLLLLAASCSSPEINTQATSTRVPGSTPRPLASTSTPATQPPAQTNQSCMNSASRSGEWQTYSNPLQDSGWVSLSPRFSGALYDIVAIEPGKALVAGQSIMLWGIDGQSMWQKMRNKNWSFSRDLWAIALTGDDQGWAVGMEGWLIHFEGYRWQQVIGPSCDHLWDVQMLASGEGWIVGENGAIWHYHGEQWIAASSPTLRTLYALDLVSSDTGWAVKICQ